MQRRQPLTAIFATLFVSLPLLAAPPEPSNPPIINAATEATSLDPKLPDGGLPPVLGVQNFQVFRASRADDTGLPPESHWTYNHHMDLAQWHGRMYLAWTNGEKDEDTWPAHELYISTANGVTWSKPAELFPQGVSTSLRTYFFHAPSGHMLAIAGLRTGTEKLDEAKKGGVVVREIRTDHTLGPVYTLIDPPAPAKPMIPMPKFDTAGDQAFIQACRELLDNHTFLEQQDDGTLLGQNRMAAYQGASKDFGRAMCFFHRADGTLVGIGKKAWAVTSTDDGKTWSPPIHIPTLITGNAKEWVQRTTDGKYALLYDPSTTNRFPLALLTSDDGITFNNMRIVHGQVPVQRYAGVSKSIGPQYVRGISEWARDDSSISGPGAKDLWVVYSVNKEDIWVSRIPVPIKIAETAAVHDTFTTPGSLIEHWNTYSPLWAPVSITLAPDGTPALTLTDRDPYDYAEAQRLFPETPNPRVHLQLMIPASSAPDHFEIQLAAPFGDVVPVRLTLEKNLLSATDGDNGISKKLGTLPFDRWIDLSLEARADAGTCSIAVSGSPTITISLAEKTNSFQRLILRTGPHRPLVTAKDPKPAPESDRPLAPAAVFIKQLDIR